ncbi:MAG: DNA mismatch repair protein MutS, partial [Candidatus Cloacimonetes bacterium]|nr:DNA mismatch repair protein MutS [Candidatus Cloacimonadota bacterium]
RQSVISRFLANTAYLKDLRARLKDIGDLSRLVSRIAALRVNPRELNSLRSYLLVCAEIVECLAKFPGEAFLPWMNHLKGYEDICELVDRAILENPPHTITEGGIFKKGYNADLDEFKDIIYDGKSMIARLEEEEKRKTGIPSLKIGYNKVFGYYIEVTSTHKHRVPEYYTAKQTLVNSERYISPRLKEFEAKVLSAEERIKNLEYELYRELRNSVSSHLNRLIELSDILSLIDVFSSLAFLAWQNNYTAPQILEERELEIVEGRHPVIEKLLTEDEFIPNDTVLNYDQTRIAIITGPNMAGKSTYLRQIGLLVILAQIGSYVPAKRMKLPIFDRVFTRVGASDNLAQGQSTFLVEMIETANILHSATPNSLILLDEIGRGTSTFDGLSLAWAIIEHIEKHNHSLTLFATHYHELTELENIYPAIWNYNVAVKQWNDQIIFLRKIERGGADQSYGIQVARLAGIPHKVIIRAKDILRNLEEHEISPQGLTATIRKKLNKNVPQIEIFELMMDKTDDKDNLLQEIKEINLDETSPAQALQILYDLQKKLSE